MKPYSRLALLVPALLAAVGLLSSSSHAARSHPPSRRTVVMVIVPAITLDDLTSGGLPSFRRVMDRGAIGLMNSRTAGRPPEQNGEEPDELKTASESGYVTLGAGARAIAGSDAREAFGRDERVQPQDVPAGSILTQRTLTAPGSAEVVNIGIAKLARDNSTLSYSITIGSLGKLLHAAGLKTAVIGNSDNGSPHRDASTVCMDDLGRVDFGNVGASMSSRDIGAPYGLTMNEGAIVSEVRRCVTRAGLVVVDLGDMSRVERMRPDMLDASFEAERSNALRRTDKVLGSIVDALDWSETTLLVVSPYPPSQVAESTGNTLCPVIAAGLGVERGLLCSASTRVPGVITNCDILPTVLAWLGIPAPKSAVGRPMSSSASDAPEAVLASLNHRVSMQSIGLPILRQSAVAVIVLIALMTLLWVRLPAGHPLRRRVTRIGAFTGAALAPAMLLVTLWPSESVLVTWLMLIGLVCVLAAAASAISRRSVYGLALLSTVFVGAASYDLLTGGTLCRYSIMAYSLSEGARYYGMGNEFMGAYIGAAVILVCAMLGAVDAKRWVAYLVLFAGLVVSTAVIGAPGLGTNMGGAVAAIFAFGIALAAARRKAVSLRGLAAICLTVVAVLAIFAVIDSRGGQSHQSHLGRAIGLAQSGGISQIGIIIQRKLEMNLMLIRLSVWSRLLLAYLVSGAIVLAAGKSSGIALLRSQPIRIRAAFAGIISGSIAALVFNDSGIVAAATCIVYGWALLMAVMADREIAGGSSTCSL